MTDVIDVPVIDDGQPVDVGSSLIVIPKPNGATLTYALRNNAAQLLSRMDRFRVEPPAELAAAANEIALRGKSVVVSNDAELEAAYALRGEAKALIGRIEDDSEPLTKVFDRLHKLFVAARSALCAKPDAVAKACDAAITPYLRERKRREEAERLRLETELRQQQEAQRALVAARIKAEADARAAQERAAAEKLANEARERAEAEAKLVEAAAQAKAEELALAGKEAEALAAIDEAAERMTNLRQDGEEAAVAVVAEAETVAVATETEGAAIAEDVATTPIIPVHVAMPQGPSVPQAKKLKCDRTNADKVKAILFVASEIQRGNFSPSAWFDFNFARIDSYAKDMQTLFPPRDDVFELDDDGNAKKDAAGNPVVVAKGCGISIYEDIQIRSSRK